MEGLQANVQRLKTYKAKLVVFPRRARKTKVNSIIIHSNFFELLVLMELLFFKCPLTIFSNQAGDSTPEELATATQVQGPVLPISREKVAVELVKVTDEMKSFNAYAKLRLERTNKRHLGARLKRAAEAEKEEKK